MAASHGGRTPRSTTLAAVKKEANSPVSALKDNVARAVEFHSGASVRTRAASQSGPLAPSGSPGTRGRIGAGQNAVAAAHEREKGKSPLVPQSRRPHPPQSRGVKGENGDQVALVTGFLEINVNSTISVASLSSVMFFFWVQNLSAQRSLPDRFNCSCALKVMLVFVLLSQY